MSIYGFCKKVYRLLLEAVSRVPSELYKEIKSLPADSKKVLLISHELTHTGAPIVLLNIAKILRKRGFLVIVISPLDGSMRYEFEMAGISVYTSYCFQYAAADIVKLSSNFDLVIVNTITQYRTLWYLKGFAKVLWLLHEAVDFETYFLKWYSLPAYNCPSVLEVLKTSKNVYTVSGYSKAIFDKYSDNVRVLYNGVPEIAILPQERDSDKLQISFIGSVNERKAVDIFVAAVKNLPEKYRQKVKFNIIGEAKGKFAKGLKKESTKYINWLGSIKDRKTLNKIYNKTDLLVCVSRDDPAPLVVAEAASCGVPSVISENVGSTYLIEDEKSGFIIPTENVDALKKVLMQVIENPEILLPMKKLVRKKYLQTSTMEMFEKNFIGIVDRIINEK